MTILTDKQQAAIEAYELKGSQRKAAKHLGISTRAFRSRFDAAKAKLLNTPVGFKTTKVSTDDYGTIKAMTHKLAPETNDEKREGRVVRRSTLYGADGSVTGEWIIRKPEDEVEDEYHKALEKQFCKETIGVIESPFIKTNNVCDNDLALFLSVDDHIGVQLSKKIVGEDYGLKEAVNLMSSKFDVLLNRTPVTQTCMYVNLGDKFHANDHMDVTPQSKHELHSDTDFDTVSDAVVQLEIERIQKLASVYEHVVVRSVRGNHDIDPSGWLMRCLDIAFRNDPKVDVHFWSDGLGVEVFGNNFLGFHHGDKMKPEVMAGAAADRFPREYGETKMRYLHTGHIHHDSEKDTWGGFKWRSHRTMAPKDKFSYENGYLSRQTMKSYVYNNNEGEVGNFLTNLV